MTKKDYEAIAGIIADNHHNMLTGDSPTRAMVKMIASFCEMFEADNKRFDAGKFKAEYVRARAQKMFELDYENRKKGLCD